MLKICLDEEETFLGKLESASAKLISVNSNTPFNEKCNK